MSRSASEIGKTIGIAYLVILGFYFEYMHHARLSQASLDSHLWIFGTLVLLGVLAWSAVAVGRPKS